MPLAAPLTHCVAYMLGEARCLKSVPNYPTQVLPGAEAQMMS